MEKNYIITHEGLRDAQPAHLQGMQVVFAPYLDGMIFAWWVLFGATTAVVLAQFLKRIHAVHIRRTK